jgi:hypothetical protein
MNGIMGVHRLRVDRSAEPQNIQQGTAEDRSEEGPTAPLLHFADLTSLFDILRFGLGCQLIV